MLKKIGIYVVLILALTWCAREVIYYGIRNTEKGLYRKLDEMFLQKNNYNTLFIGSSRAEGHFNPAIFDSITGLNSFNIGMSGSNNAFTYSLLKVYLSKSEAPEKIIINLDFHFSHESSDTIYNFPRYFPYLANEALYKELIKFDKRFILFKFFPPYTLSQMGDKCLNNALRGYLHLNGPYMQESYKGNEKLIPLNYKLIDSLPCVNYRASILPENLNYLDSIFMLSKKSGAKFYFVISPTYYKGSHRIINLKEHLNRFKNFAQERNIPFFDYTEDSLSYNKAIFADFYHMKGIGADLFTRKFSIDFVNFTKE